MYIYICVCVYTFSVLTYPEPYIPREIAPLLFLKHCNHILCNRVSLFLLKKSWLKRKYLNLESFNNESGILPIQPTLFQKHNRHMKCTF